jgi:hypothetical protein
MACDYSPEEYDLVLLCTGASWDYRARAEWAYVAHDRRSGQAILNVGGITGAIDDYVDLFPVLHALGWHREHPMRRPHVPVRVLVLTMSEVAAPWTGKQDGPRGDSPLRADLELLAGCGYQLTWQPLETDETGGNRWYEWIEWMAEEYGTMVWAWLAEFAAPKSSEGRLASADSFVPWAVGDGGPHEAGVAADGVQSP